MFMCSSLAVLFKVAKPQQNSIQNWVFKSGLVAMMLSCSHFMNHLFLGAYCLQNLGSLWSFFIAWHCQTYVWHYRLLLQVLFLKPFDVANQHCIRLFLLKCVLVSLGVWNEFGNQISCAHENFRGSHSPLIAFPVLQDDDTQGRYGGELYTTR